MFKSTDFVLVTKNMQVYATNTPDGKLVIADVQPVLEFSGEHYALNVENLSMCNTKFFFDERNKVFTITDHCPKYKSEMVKVTMDWIAKQKGNLFRYIYRVGSATVCEPTKLELYKRIEWDEEEYIVTYGNNSLSIIESNPCLVKVELDYFVPININCTGYKMSENRTESIRVVGDRFEVMGHNFKTVKDAQDYAVKKILGEIFPDLFTTAAATENKTVVKEQELKTAPITQFKRPFTLVQPELKAAATKEPEQPKHRGRKAAPLPDPKNWDQIYLAYLEKCITKKDAIQMAGVSPYIFKRLVEREEAK